MSRSKRISLTPALLNEIEQIITSKVTGLRLHKLRNNGGCNLDNQLVELNKDLLTDVKKVLNK